MARLTPDLIEEGVGPITKQVKALQTVAEELRQAATDEERQAALKKAQVAARKLIGAADELNGQIRIAKA